MLTPAWQTARPPVGSKLSVPRTLSLAGCRLSSSVGAGVLPRVHLVMSGDTSGGQGCCQTSRSTQDSPQQHTSPDVGNFQVTDPCPSKLSQGQHLLEKVLLTPPGHARSPAKFSEESWATGL